jgi:hypothetical protein
MVYTKKCFLFLFFTDFLVSFILYSCFLLVYDLFIDLVV